MAVPDDAICAPSDDAGTAGVPEAAASEKSTQKLTAGPITATVVIPNPDKTYALGPAFAKVSLASQSSRKFETVELVLAAKIATVLKVSGHGVKLLDNGGTRIVRVEAIARGKPRDILIEVRLNDPGQPGETNSLTLTLRQTAKDSGPGQSATATWRVADCAGRYHDALTALQDGPAATMRADVKAARTPHKGFPGKWLFASASRKVVKPGRLRRVCRHWVVDRDFFGRPRGRYCAQRSMVRGKPVVRVISTRLPGLTDAENDAATFAADFVGARGSDPELSIKRNAGWVANRIATDLGTYLGQNPNPALCTGANQVMDYFSKKLEPVEDRAKEIAETAAKATAFARKRTSELADRVADAGDGTTGTTGGGAHAETGPHGSGTLTDLVVTAAARLDAPDLAGTLARADGPLAALKLIDDALDDGAGKALSETANNDLRRALAMIEVAAYLQTVNKRYKAVQHSIVASISRVRDVHARACTCGH